MYDMSWTYDRMLIHRVEILPPFSEFPYVGGMVDPPPLDPSLPPLGKSLIPPSRHCTVGHHVCLSQEIFT